MVSSTVFCLCGHSLLSSTLPQLVWFVWLGVVCLKLLLVVPWSVARGIRLPDCHTQLLTKWWESLPACLSLSSLYNRSSKWLQTWQVYCWGPQEVQWDIFTSSVLRLPEAHTVQYIERKLTITLPNGILGIAYSASLKNTWKKRDWRSYHVAM